MVTAEQSSGHCPKTRRLRWTWNASTGFVQMGWTGRCFHAREDAGAQLDRTLILELLEHVD